MFKSVGCAWHKLAAVITTLMCCLGLSGQAFAQNKGPAINPERYVLDPLGIDIASTNFIRRDVQLTIGDPAHGGLTWGYMTAGAPYRGELIEGGGGNSFVIIEGDETVFLPLSTYVNASGTGATLVKSGSNFIFTSQDGTIYNFTGTGASSSGAVTTGQLTSYQKPDGVVVTINYSNFAQGVIQSVISSAGYALKYSDKIYAINLAAHTCDASLNCDGYDNYISYQGDVPNSNSPLGKVDQITDALGNQWQYSVYDSYEYTNPRTDVETDGPQVLHYYKDPSGYSATINYDNAGRITTFIDPRGTFTFSYGGQTVAMARADSGRDLTVTDPSGATLYSAGFGDGIMDSYQDGLGNRTTYNITFTTVGPYGANPYYNRYSRLISVTKPEGNSITYSYDARGNATQATNTPKSGSGLSATTIYANYDSTCTNPVKCNKPNWTQDANGNYTYYTYDPTHGGVTLVQSPADSNGVTPETVTSWAQYTAQIRNSSGSMVNAGTIWLPQTVSTCASAATCNGSASQTVTTTAYNTYNLLPSSVTTAAGDNSVSATTSFAYDGVGNKTSVDGPRTDVSDISYATYDADRRPVYEIGVDPDGSGPLPHVVTHHIYTGMLETQTETGTSPNTDGSSFTRTSYVATSYNAMGQKTLTAAYIDGNGMAQSLSQFNYDIRGRSNCTAVRMNPSVYGTIGGTDACAFGTQGSYGPDRITHNSYDNADHLLEIDQAWGVTTANGFPQTLQRAYARYTYNANGTKATETDANGNETGYVYDGFDRLSQIQYPSSTTAGSVNTADYEQFQYDNNGNKTVWRRRNGKTLYYNYDNLNREILHYVSDGSVQNVYTGYDLQGHVLYARYGSINGAGVTNWYDGFGQLATTTDMNGRTIWLGYYTPGVKTAVIWPDGQGAHSDTRDALNRITTEYFGSNWLSVFSQTYDNLGRRNWLGRAGGGRDLLWLRCPGPADLDEP